MDKAGAHFIGAPQHKREQPKPTDNNSDSSSDVGGYNLTADEQLALKKIKKLNKDNKKKMNDIAHNKNEGREKLK